VQTGNESAGETTTVLEHCVLSSKFLHIQLWRKQIPFTCMQKLAEWKGDTAQTAARAEVVEHDT